MRIAGGRLFAGGGEGSRLDRGQIIAFRTFNFNIQYYSLWVKSTTLLVSLARHIGVSTTSEGKPNKQ